MNLVSPWVYFTPKSSSEGFLKFRGLGDEEITWPEGIDHRVQRQCPIEHAPLASSLLYFEFDWISVNVYLDDWKMEKTVYKQECDTFRNDLSLQMLMSLIGVDID